MNEEKATTVLIVDDEEATRDILRYHLEKEGYKVITSKDGEEAIIALNEYNISLTITDLKMPKVDGFGVLAYVKEHCDFMPVIVLTGYVDVELAVSAMKKGCFDYITKPIKRDELTEVVQNALDKIRAARSRKRFKIGEIYLLRDDGTVIFHEKIPLSSGMDAEIFGFVITVVKTLIKNTLGAENGLKGFEHTDLKVLIEEGEGYFLTVIGQGDDVEPVKEIMRNTIEKIYLKYGDLITQLNGNAEVVRDIETIFGSLKKLGWKAISTNLNDLA